MRRADLARQARLQDPTIAEQAFEEMLVKLGVSYEKEKIIQNGDRWVLLDFCCGNTVFEIDGLGHSLQSGYDSGRTRWLKEKGYAVVRFTNTEVMAYPDETAQAVQKAIAERLLGGPVKNL